MKANSYLGKTSVLIFPLCKNVNSYIPQKLILGILVFVKVLEKFCLLN